MIGAWPATWPSQAASQPVQVPPVHVETSFNPAPLSTSLCTDRDCPHTDDTGEGPMPAMMWRGPGCLAAWTVARTAQLCEATS